MRILITGGAGFVGSSLARKFKSEGADVVTFDNLRRRGSERNVIDFQKRGIDFIHGDIRNAADVDSIAGDFDLVIDASAEPSVLAGTDGNGIRYLNDTNLNGTLNCLEFVRTRKSKLIFLSTSRVYSIKALQGIKLREDATRFAISETGNLPGLTKEGITEDFPVVGHGFRSLYGATKLASELFVEEYAQTFNMPAVINRCGVIAGPGQFGKTDQGVFTMWVARHLWAKPLQYTGFGGQGKQVRDLLHPADLHDLLKRQIKALPNLRGETFVAAGGQHGSASLMEFTNICRRVCGNTPEIKSNPQTASVDVPFFVGDSSKCQKTFDWAPKATPEDIVKDIADWLRSDEPNLKPLFA
ncbi:NAD-dependent epimerase/dehydratase family protein [bacterium]|nr:NAD-dependent epimerase/dehydratase family protein [bacterium]